MNNRSPFTYIWQILGWLGLAFFAYLCWQMLALTWQYHDFQQFTGFLALKRRAFRLEHWRIAFYVHVFSSIWVLLLGALQFSGLILRRFPKAHRRMGISYVGTILVFSAPSGLLMAYYANGGITSKIAFTLLALLWFAFTALAWRKALNRDFVSHRANMMRSYALTLSAVCLRVYSGIALGWFQTNPKLTYMVVAWAAWVPNLLVAEWIIRRKKSLIPHNP